MIRSRSSLFPASTRKPIAGLSVRVVPDHFLKLRRTIESIVTSRNVESLSVSEICAHVKHLRYAASARVRLYGEEFEVLWRSHISGGLISGGQVMVAYGTGPKPK
jgi:hypothetical protein